LLFRLLITSSSYSHLKSKKYVRESREKYHDYFNFFLRKNVSRLGDGGEMDHYFWPARHPAALLALVATAILLVAWPMENVPACVLAAVMIAVAGSIAIRTHFRSARMG
jgi:hypothetical protein